MRGVRLSSCAMRCVSSDAHEGHIIKHVDDVFLPTKRVVRAQLDTVQAQLTEARESYARAVATLDHLASNFDTEEAAVQVHFEHGGACTQGGRPAVRCCG